MKKNFFKKSITAVTAALMVAATTIPVSAADTYTITINNTTEGHTYRAYQIFAGDYDDATGILSNITWGTGVDSATVTEYESAEAAAETLLVEADAKTFAANIADNLSTTFATDDFTDSKYEFTGLAAGYYLVVDAPESLNNTDESYTSYILKVVDDVDVTPKSSVPSVEKKVQDADDTANTTTGWQDSADYDIGDKVPFQITVTLPNNFEEYDSYTLTVTDTLAAGLTFNSDSFKVQIDGTDSWCFDWPTYDSSTGKIVLNFKSAELIAAAKNNSEITISYNATLNENAVIGSAGNANEVYIEYSNNPNSEMEGDEADTGTSTTDKVVVFTYDVIINKVDQDGNALTGAEFTLEKKVNDSWTAITRLTVVDNTFTFTGLDDGTYRLTESKTPSGYNSIDPVEFTISATHSENDEAPELIELKSSLDDATVDTAAGTITADVENQSGSTLPGTGGIGRTIFFVTGGVLIVAAGIVLIIKKRMNNAD